MQPWTGLAEGWLSFPLGVLEGMGFEAGAGHPSNLCSFLIKELFLFLIKTMPPEFA